MRKYLLCSLFAFLGSINIANAGILYADSTFKLSDYAINTFQSGGASISTSQTLTGGNPGAALQSIIDIPIPSGTFYTSEYFINASFSYNPTSKGAIETIDFVGDAYFKMDPGPLGFRGISELLFQNDNYYTHFISTAADNGVWQTGSTNGLFASDFNLITDLLEVRTDMNSHPDFSNGEILFGTIISTATIGNSAQSFDARVDNISYTVNTVQAQPVPEPESIALLCLGLIGICFFQGKIRWLKNLCVKFV